MTKRLQNTTFISLLPSSIADDATIQAASTALDAVLHKVVLAVPNLLLYARLLLTAGRVSGFKLLPALERIIHARGELKHLSTPELELLAWQFHVDFRQVARTDRELANMVLESIPWHRIKGTPRSIINALALFGYGASTAQDVPSRAAGVQRLPRQSQATASAAQEPTQRACARLARNEPYGHREQSVRSSGITIEEDGTGDHWATYQLGLPQIADVATVQHIVKICNAMAPVRCRLWRIYTDAFDRRPVIWSGGTRHDRWSDGWWTYYSGVSVPEAPGSEGDIIVSFGTLRSFQSEPYALQDLAASFGATTHYGFLAPYVDRPIWSRSAWSDVFPRNHGFAMSSLFSILWADRATTGRRWRGEWDARSWLDYTGFDRKLPPWRMGQRSLSRSQNAYSGGNRLSDINACYSRPTALLLDAPPVWGASRWSAEGSKVRLLVIDERHCSVSTMSPKPVNPDIPQAAGASLLCTTAPVADPQRVHQARHDNIAAHMREREFLPPCTAASLYLMAKSIPVSPDPAPPSAVTHYRAPQWLGAWIDTGRTWATPKKIATQ